MSTEQWLLTKAGGAKNQRHVETINTSQTINGAQQKCTRARDNTRKQNNTA